MYPRCIRVGNPFTLTHWIEGEYDESQLRQRLAAALVVRRGLAFLIVAALEQNAGKRSTAA